MDHAKKGMSLFELLIVMIIVGIVYSIGLFAINKEKAVSSTIKASELKSALRALDHNQKIRMICDNSCHECRVLDTRDSVVASIRLSSDGTLQRYGFDRLGELRPLGKTVTSIDNKLSQECFEFTLYPDGTSSPLILKDNASYYLYTPLQGEKPFITDSAETLRLHLFDERRYPLKNDRYYVQQH